MTEKLLKKLKNLTAIFVIILTLFLSISLVMISSNPLIYNFIDIGIYVRYLFLITLVVTTIALIINGIAFNFLNEKISRVMLFVMFYWIFFSGFFFPLVEGGGMKNITEMELNYGNLIFVMFCSITAGILHLTSFRTILLVFVGTFLILNFSINIIKVNLSNDKKIIVDEFLQVSQNNNIFVISFDGTPGSIVLRLLSEGYDKDFKDFSVFTNVVSNAPATDASIRHELFGSKNYKDLGVKTEGELINYLKKNKAMDLPINKIKDGYGYRYNYANKNLSRGDFIIGGNASISDEHRYWFDLIFIRVFGVAAYDLSHFGQATKWLMSVISEGHYMSKMSELIAKYKGTEDWKAPNLIAYDDFKIFIDKLNVSKDKEKSIRFMHFTHTHIPVDFDSNCVMRSIDYEWAKSVQNYNGLYEQGKCELSQFVEFINKLKSLNIYDSSLIVLKSDHGQPTTYFNDTPDTIKFNGHKLFGYSRYRPFLMIKNFSQKSDFPTYINYLVALSDLAKTICLSRKNNSNECESFDGIDLLSNFDNESVPNIYLEIVVNDKSNYLFEEHEVIEIKRSDGNDFLELLKSNNNERKLKLDLR